MKDKAWQSSPPDQQARRSIYVFSKRSLLLPLLTTFDFCDTTQPCGQRDVNVVAPQALALLNNEFTHQASGQIAKSIIAAGCPRSNSPETNAYVAWMRILGREVNRTEWNAAVSHLHTQRTRYEVDSVTADRSSELALASLCHVLLNTNELTYVD